MRSNERKNGENRRKVEYQKRKQLKSRLFLLFSIISFVLLTFYIKDIKIQLEEIQKVLKKIEILQYEKIVVLENCNSEGSFIESIPVIDIEKPIQRTKNEAIQYLKKLGNENPIIKKICDNSSFYPDNLLIALANNPEMGEFIAGYLNQNENVSAILSDSEKEESYPLFLQWDPRWGYVEYGKNGIMGISGCGPTCMSMVLYYLTSDEMLTPDKMAAYAMENGYYVEGAGTAWAFMEDIPQLYDVKVTKPRNTERAMKAALDKGRIIICAMGKGDFTIAGHFIVIYGYDEEGFKVNDPNSVARSRKRWSFDEIVEQINSIWAYEK